MKTNRIIQISAYYPPHLGGQENVVHDFAHCLGDAGHDVHVVTSAVGGIKGNVREGSVMVHRLWGFEFGHAPIMPQFVRQLARIVRPGDTVHLHIGQAFTPEMVWLASRIYKFSYIAELHIDFVPSGPAGWLLPLYKRFVLQRALNGAAAVITLNEKTLATVRDFYEYKGIARVMHNGIDERYFTLKRKPLPKHAPQTLQLLFVGRLSKQKNVPMLLKALQQTNRSVQLDIVGDGEEYAEIQRIIESENISNVILHGRLEREAVFDFYERCHALIMPSLYEAQPLVLLEAMAARIPIIGTNVIGVAEHIGDAGIVVEPTVEGIQHGIEQFYARYGELNELVKRGSLKADAMRWKNTIKQYEELYDEVRS